jgi:hypothetical protein
MKILRSFYEMRLFSVVIVILALMIASCGVRRVGTPPPEENTGAAAPIFDPLGTPQDREIVPEVHPVVAAALPDSNDSLVQPPDLTYLQFDSASAAVAPTEVYRVQIFTSRLYSEAARERTLAEEIFNLPIYLDYEVPYYKLRVGDFQTRDEAENMVPEIKNIGYRNAWVARVVLRVQEAPEYELMEEPILPEDSTVSPALPSDSAYQENGSENP